MYGAKGKILSIDLTEKTTSVIKLPDEMLIKYVGGRALGARMLYDYLPPNADPLGPENTFIILTGIVTGTMVPCSGKYVVVTKSPLTGAFLDSYSSGTLSFQLKAAGWDGLMLKGRCSTPTYLYINNDKIEFRDASHIWGKGSIEAEDMLLSETDPQAGAIVIGPAGEKLVRVASLNSEHYRQAGRGGGGAVLGSKLIKGIAVRGTGSVEAFDPESIRKYYLECVEFMEHNKGTIARRRFGTPLTMNTTNAAGMLPTKNFQRSHCEEAIDNLDAEGCEKNTVHDRACQFCPIGCSKVSMVKEGRYKDTVVEGPEYETVGILGSNLGITYLPAVLKGNLECDDLGLDTISAGVIVGFVMECFEKGLLTEEEIGVKNPVFGNDEAALELVRMISSREGFGDRMAEGVKRLSEYVGKGSEHFAMQIKGMEFPAYDPRAGYASCLGYAVNPRGACHRRCWPPALEILGNRPRFSIEGKAELVVNIYNVNTILHSVLLCDFANKSAGVPIQRIAEYLSAVAGHTFTVEQLQRVADRAETLARLINYREGFRRKDDTLPERFLTEPTPDGPGAGKTFTREMLNTMLDEYYELRGWDNDGRPKKETLDRLGIEPSLQESEKA